MNIQQELLFLFFDKSLQLVLLFVHAILLYGTLRCSWRKCLLALRWCLIQGRPNQLESDGSPKGGVHYLAQFRPASIMIVFCIISYTG